MIHKIFYIEDLPYEIQERLTSIDPNMFARQIRTALGDSNRVITTMMSSASFCRKYQELGVSMTDIEGKHIALPPVFVNVIGANCVDY